MTSDRPPVAAPSRRLRVMTAATSALAPPPVDGDGGLCVCSDRLTPTLLANMHDGASLSMVPSHIHALPTGREQGTVLAIDLGGSTLRVAVVELGDGSSADAVSGNATILTQHQWAVGPAVKQLSGVAFFDWIGTHIGEAVVAAGEQVEAQARSARGIDAGLVWSFPLEQTSLDNGRLQVMGKGFDVDGSLRGKEMKTCLGEALEKLNLHVRLTAILNDSVAVLVAGAYTCPAATRLGLVAGTGFNAAVVLPTAAMGTCKFAARPPSRWDAAAAITTTPPISLVDVELCIAGGEDVFATARWDDAAARLLPPGYRGILEQFVGALYLAELVRAVVLEAVQSDGFFGGHVPGGSFAKSCGFDTRLMAAFEGDTSPTLDAASAAFLAAYPLPERPPVADWQALRALCVAVSSRAAAYVAVGVHALWRVMHDSLAVHKDDNADADTPEWIVGCGGAMLEKYPGFLPRCQAVIDSLTARSQNTDGVEHAHGRRLVIQACPESSVKGAAIAAVMSRAVE